MYHIDTARFWYPGAARQDVSADNVTSAYRPTRNERIVNGG